VVGKKGKSAFVGKKAITTSWDETYESCTGIGDIHNTSDMALHWRTAEEEVDLVIVVSYDSNISIGRPGMDLQSSQDLPYRRRYSITLKQVWRYATVASR
jgi:hypothetical protein